MVAIVVIVTFGVNFRKGFLLFQLLIWTGLITEIIKTIIAFPRPDYVDNRVLNLEYGVKSTSPFNGSGPDDVFELPDKKKFLKPSAFKKHFPLRLLVSLQGMLQLRPHSGEEVPRFSTAGKSK
ncbi:hypothetical protein [Methanosarcina barkeri]|uniref:hypothetical protein n=1 Tax=Methanosarcina barkeri TaxID=2208 RepID=UPI0006D2195D|nr:hypothetical protein [Methanosarcina barkeri]